MRKKIKLLTYCITISVCFLSAMKGSSQNAENQQPLADVLKQIETNHAVKFNYAIDAVEGLNVIPPAQSLDLKTTLTYLEQRTPLLYEVSSNQLILVTNKKGIWLCGYVLDNRSKKPLSDATIQAKNSSAISEADGFFSITVNQLEEEINFRFLGYIEHIIKAQELISDRCQPILLRSELQELSEVVISSFLVKGINKLSDGSLLIDFTAFDLLPGIIDTDVLQSIQALPGIQSSNETVSNINIRGGTHDQNLILWDGIKMYQSGHFFGLISMYNPQITQKVSLKKNGTSSDLTDGVSGTISMETDDAITDTFKGNIGSNLIDLNAFVDIPFSEKSSLQIAGRKAISDFVETPVYNNFFERIAQNTEVENNEETIINTDKAFDFYDVSARWLYNISDKDKLRVNFIHVANDLMFDEQTTASTYQESRESSISQSSLAAGISYTRLWKPDLSSTIEIFETDYKLKAINANILEAQRFLQENKVSETSVKLQTNYNLNENASFFGGYHFVETEVTNLDDIDTPVFRFLVSEVLRSHGLFSQMHYEWNENKTSLDVGLRFNYLEKFKRAIFEPRFNFKHEFLSNVLLQFSGEFKHQNTSQLINFQSDFLGIEKRRWQLSNNEDIPIIQSKQLSAGITYNLGGWLLNLEGYFKEVDGITSQSQGFQNQFEFERTIGSYQVFGYDLILRKQIRSLSTWFSYSFMDNTYKFDELEDDRFQSNYNIRHAITLGTTYSANRLKISGGINWHSGNPTTGIDSENSLAQNELIYLATNNQRLKDYLRVDVSGTYKFNFSKATSAIVGISVWNLLNRQNQHGRFFRINDDTIQTRAQESLGITPNVSFRVYF